MCEEQFLYLKKIRAISKLPKGKRLSTTTKRAFKVVNIVMILRSLEMQKHIIMSQPIAPKFKKGGVVVAGNYKGKEMVIIPNGKKISIIPKK